MTDETRPKEEPQIEQKWAIIYDGNLAIADVVGHRQLAQGDFYDVEPLYSSNTDELPEQVTHPMREFHARLPEHDEWDEKYEELLDYALSLITPEDVAELLDGEPSHMTNGERGYEALQFFALDGIEESITEWSVHQGHGPSRYGSSVQNRLYGLPTWLQEDVLDMELGRWEGGPFDEEQAAYTVELLLLKEEFLDEDHEDEIRELVNEYDLEYDEYRTEEC